MRFTRFLRSRFQKQPEKPLDFFLTTEEDIYSCYRILLNREPDEAGLNYWKKMVNQFQIPLPFLVNGFINGPEFRQLQAKQALPQLVELSHFQMYVRPNDFFIGAVIAREKTYEPAVTQQLEQLLSPGWVFVDIGANIGYFSLLAACLVGENGRVYAFEPKPDNCHLIQESLKVNGFTNVTIFQNVVAEKAQTFSFSDGGADSNGRLMHDFEIENPTHWLTVEAITLDETLPVLPRLDVIKMDIEGAEPRAWQGMGQTIARYRPTIIMEFSSSYIQTTSRLDPCAFLDEVQQMYHLYILHRDGRKSNTPQSTAAILQTEVNDGHHLDLLAYPRE